MEICLSIWTINMYIYLIKENKCWFYGTYRLPYLEYISPKKKLTDIHGASCQIAVRNTARTSSHRARNTPANYTSWECQHDSRAFHKNEFNPIFSKKVRGWKHYWEVCNYGHINMIGVKDWLKYVYSLSCGSSWKSKNEEYQIKAKVDTETILHC